MIAVVDLSVFLGKKIENITGKPTPLCSLAGGATNVPLTAACRSNIHLGGHPMCCEPKARSRAWKSTIVFASHANSPAASA